MLNKNDFSCLSKRQIKKFNKKKKLYFMFWQIHKFLDTKINEFIYV